MSKKSRLLICCEGETERQYVIAVASALKIKNMPKVLNPAASDPMGVLAEAYKEYCWSQAVDPVPFTEIWLIFDRDHHPTYEQVFKLAPKLGPEIHLCWTNPCIEFWFWLHFSGDVSELKFDDELQLSCEEKTVDLGYHVREITRVRRVLYARKPETMLSILKKHCAGYSKVHCPQGLVERTVKACDHLQAVAQSKDPMRMGSAMPDLLLRLARLAEDSSAPSVEPPVAEAVPVAAEVVPAPEAVPPPEVLETEAKEKPVEKALEASEALDLSMAEKTEEIRKALKPLDPWQACVAPLLSCLEDWKNIRVMTEGITVSNAAVDRLEQFFRILKVAEESTGPCKYANGCLETLGALRRVRNLGASPTRIKKMQRQLRALGVVLRLFANNLGMQKSAENLDFLLFHGTGLLPAEAKPAVVPAPIASKEQTAVTVPVEKPAESLKEPLIVEAATAETVEAPSAPEAKEEATPVSAPEVALPVEEEHEDNLAETAVSESKAKEPAPEVAISGKTLTLREELDLWKACAERVRICIDDWKSIKVTLEGITFSDEAVARLEEFFMAMKAAEEATGTCNRSQICLETLEALKANRALEVSPHLIAKMQKQFRALGTVMRAMAKKVGWKKRDLVGIDFELTSGAGVSDEQAATVPLPELKFGSESAPESKAAEEQPVASAPLEPAAESLPETTEEDELRSRLQELKSLQTDFERMMRFVVLHKGEPPQEMLPGLCEKATGVHQNALAVVESCLELLAGMPVEKAEPASAPAP